MKHIKIIVVGLTALLLTGCNKQQLNEYSKNMFYMDTYINVKVYTKDEKQAKKAFKEAEKIYEKYDSLTNMFDENSELSKLNNNKEEGYIDVNKDLLDILKISHEWYEKSEGYFNVNIGNLTKIWKEYKEKEILPSELIKNLEIYPFTIKNNKIKNENLNLDLGGVSKGYATEKAGQKLEEMNIENYLIDAGGNIKLGKSYNKDNFKIGIKNPEIKNDIYQVIKGQDISIVTSGGYERFFEVDGKRYHHIIDPKTKYPANHMLSATIITKDSALADILSTTIFLMPKEKALELVESLKDVECILYISSDEIIKSSGIKNYE